MTKKLLLLAGLLWGSLRAAAGQQMLDRAGFQATPVFSEEFSYLSVVDPQFRARWDADFYTAVNNAWTEYSPSSQLEMLPGGFLKIRITRLNLAERQAATDSAARHGVGRPAPVPPGTTTTASSPNGGPIAYASGKLISKVAIDPVRPTAGPGFNGFTYGLFEIRCKLPASGPGIAPAFWLHSPGTEIDIIDNCNENPSRLWQVGVLDWARRYAGCGGDTAKLACWATVAQLYQSGRDLSQDFNTYGAVWTPEHVTFYLNEQLLFTVPASGRPTHAETARLILNVATGGADSFASGEMIIDYIRVWKSELPLVPYPRRGPQP